MPLIDHINFATTLKQSANPAGSSPDGNVYFDTTTDEWQLIGVDELATVDFGGGPVTNPLNNVDGITMQAIYNFENQERVADEDLRKFKRGTRGGYRFAGAFAFINGVKLRAADRAKIRGSGWIEYAAAGDGKTNIDRIYHGITSLVDIQAGTVPYYALVTATDEATLQAATWSDFSRAGDIDEAVQVYGSTANGDTGAGDFDYTDRTLVIRVRSWGYNPGETTSVDAGISEFSGFSAGYGVGESLDTANTYTLADVYGGAAISPFTGMSLEKLATPQTETGFNESDGDFTWRLNNTEGGTALECAVYAAAAWLQDADIDAGAGTYNGKKGRVWVTRNADGKIVTSSVGGEGLLISGLSTAEKQNVIQTDDSGNPKTYPYFPDVQIDVGAVAPTDPNAWYRVLYVDGAGDADYDKDGAVTVEDSGGNPVNGNVAADVVGSKISFPYSYDTNTQAGLNAGEDKPVVVVVEGDGVAAQAITYATITRDPVVAIVCAPEADDNA